MHGDMESGEDVALIYGDQHHPGLHGLAAQAGQYHQTRAGNAGNLGYQEVRNGIPPLRFRRRARQSARLLGKRDGGPETKSKENK